MVVGSGKCKTNFYLTFYILRLIKKKHVFVRTF